MPGPLEPVLMQKFSIKYAEARKLSCGGRKNLGMNRFEAWTPELEAECCRLFNEKWAPVNEKVELCSPPIDPSISKGTSVDEDSTEATEDLSEYDAESEDQESCVREQESCSTEDEAERSRILNEKWADIKDNVEPRSLPIDSAISKGTSCDEDLSEYDAESEDQESCVREQESRSTEVEAERSRIFNKRWADIKEEVEPRSPPIDPVISKGTSCDEDLSESEAESEDQESSVPEHESCSVAAIPSAVIEDPVKRTQRNSQDSQPRDSAIHYFLGNLLGDGLNICEVIVDNAKMAPDRAIDFDALVEKRIRREELWKLRRRQKSRRGGRRKRVPTDNRFISSPPVSGLVRVQNQPSVVLLQDFHTTLDTCEKKGSSAAPKPPQRCESADNDDLFSSDIILLQKSVKQSKAELADIDDLFSSDVILLQKRVKQSKAEL